MLVGVNSNAIAGDMLTRLSDGFISVRIPMVMEPSKSLRPNLLLSLVAIIHTTH